MSDDRTYGRTRDCRGCRYWSEMIAQAIGGGPVEAYCLGPEGSKRGSYTTGRDACPKWASGEHGAVDDPSQPDSAYA